jgi:hypothetical protein
MYTRNFAFCVFYWNNEVNTQASRSNHAAPVKKTLPNENRIDAGEVSGVSPRALLASPPDQFLDERCSTCAKAGLWPPGRQFTSRRR